MRLREVGRKGVVVAVSVGERKGERKKAVATAQLQPNHGIIGDVHCGENRQVSLLARESIRKLQEKGLKVTAGDFSENITTEGIALYSLRHGSLLAIGDVILEVTEVGAESQEGNSHAGENIPRECVFTKVIRGGRVKPADVIEIVSEADAIRFRAA